MMSIASRNLFSCPNPQINTVINASRKPQFRNPKFSLFTPPIPLLNPSIFETREPHFTIFRETTSRCDNSDWRIRVKPFDLDGTMTFGERGGDRSSNSEFHLDGFLSFLSFLCLASSVAISIILALNSGVTVQQKLIFPWFGEKGLLWQCAFLVVGVFVGTVIRRRQWRRICKADFFPRTVNFVERIEKVEAELKSSATMIQVLSRQLEKLGIRYRVFRKALKEPIAETAALAQKNSEATRALAMQEDILEKELVEIQKVLLAMQDQQQKQLELILAIAKSGKLWDNQEEGSRGDNTAVVDGVPQPNSKPFQGLAGQKEPQS